MFEDPVQTLVWISILKIVIGSALGIVLIGSLYKFKASIMTTFGLLLLSNLLCLYVLMVMMSS